mmetsp:Transcript_62488/g.141283  ORF Transcript_62488/g.141283 Transcript_62488/m.141283 type:complete len:137 (+) Transcript_62488:135-545(+)
MRKVASSQGAKKTKRSSGSSKINDKKWGQNKGNKDLVGNDHVQGSLSNTYRTSQSTVNSGTEQHSSFKRDYNPPPPPPPEQFLGQPSDLDLYSAKQAVAKAQQEFVHEARLLQNEIANATAAINAASTRGQQLGLM